MANGKPIYTLIRAVSLLAIVLVFIAVLIKDSNPFIPHYTVSSVTAYDLLN